MPGGPSVKVIEAIHKYASEQNNQRKKRNKKKIDNVSIVKKGK